MRTITFDTIVPLIAGLLLIGASLMHSVCTDTQRKITYGARVIVAPQTGTAFVQNGVYSAMVEK